MLVSEKKDSELYELLSKELKLTVGVHLSFSRFKLLEDEIRSLIRKFASYDSLLSSPSFPELIHLLTNHESSFFRHEEHFHILYYHIFPEFFKYPENKQIYIWSAGCSYGQEVYSLAIILEEYLDMVYMGSRKLTQSKDLLLFHDYISILGTDVSGEVLSHARKGVYSLKELDRNGTKFFKLLIDNYCSVKNQELAVTDLIVKQTDFKVHNLLSDDIPGEFDIVFCRNVLIYFEIELRMFVIKQLVSSLKRGGYLFLGPSEIVEKITGMEEVHIDKCIIYRKM